MRRLHIFGHLIRYPILILKQSLSHLIHMSHSHLHISYHVITLHLISSLPLSYKYHDYHPSPLSPHITQHNTSQLTHHHINTMTTSHSPADDGRKNSSESSCYAYIYCYFYVFTQLYKSLKYYFLLIFNLSFFPIAIKLHSKIFNDLLFSKKQILSILTLGKAGVQLINALLNTSDTPSTSTVIVILRKPLHHINDELTKYYKWIVQ